MKAGKGKVFKTAKIVRRFKTGPAEIEIGENCLIGDFAFIAVKKLEMEYGSQIAPHAILSGGGEVRLGMFSVVGFGTQLITGTDTPEGEYMCEAAPIEKRHVVRGKIVLEEGAYLGSGSIVCVTAENPEIFIGEDAVVGAFSYIDHSISPNMIVHPKQELIWRRRVEE